MKSGHFIHYYSMSHPIDFEWIIWNDEYNKQCNVYGNKCVNKHILFNSAHMFWIWQHRCEKKVYKKKFISFFTLIRLNLFSCFGISNDFIMEQFFMSTMIKSIDLHIHTHNQCTIMIKSVRILRNFELFFFLKIFQKAKDVILYTHIYIWNSAENNSDNNKKKMKSATYYVCRLVVVINGVFFLLFFPNFSALFISLSTVASFFLSPSLSLSLKMYFYCPCDGNVNVLGRKR